MKRLKLSDRLALVATRRFPARFGAAGLPHRAVVGIGGNVGDVASRFDRVIDYMRRSGRVRVLETSPLLENPPFGYLDQPDFLNGVILLETAMDALSLMRWLLWVEKRFGRRRTFPNAPRTLDLDIIFYDDLQKRTRRLYVPHPHYRERESVMIPLQFLEGMRR
ncbi:2-amino-4-hydroxy-6-hydroxymethyldihydropteridine diphosphokinase [Hydrogenimonas sp. SS33]|uniref:2-amino-4-hydroxy-6- hydroxymethyldihydropteridine diphosphokinase n=1 Tax=Hydrogenimonas leucolamina TaxID=2954236 RepID=UPI00336BF3A9